MTAAGMCGSVRWFVRLLISLVSALFVPPVFCVCVQTSSKGMSSSSTSFTNRRQLLSAALEHALPASVLREIRSLIVSYHSDISLIALSSWPVLWDWTPTFQPLPPSQSQALAVQRMGGA